MDISQTFDEEFEPMFVTDIQTNNVLYSTHLSRFELFEINDMIAKKNDVSIQSNANGFKKAMQRVGNFLLKFSQISLEIFFELLFNVVASITF